jgi:NADPH-dependent 2,4-dienoyl-CoA reductase/sulfur reductase-like enzyme
MFVMIRKTITRKGRHFFMTRLLILGGSDAGISAALRAREVDPSTQVAVVVADSFPNYSICGLPFYLSGEVPDYHELAHRTEEEIMDEDIGLLLNHTARSIDPVNHTVTMTDETDIAHQIEYDQLIIATGAVPLRPAIEGLDLPGVYFLRSMDNSFAIHDYMNVHEPRSAVIIGGGYVGLEMADALTRRGLKVTVVEHSASVLKTVDASLGKLVGAELQRHSVDVVQSVAIKRIVHNGTQLEVMGSGDFHTLCDLVLVAVGVRPLTNVARGADITLGELGAIQVTRRMETNLPDIYAAGDCVETWHRFLQRPTYLPLGTTAHKQGRIAGENAVGGSREFAGTLGTQVVKVFDLAIARTGLRDDEAVQAGYEPLTVESTFWDHNFYYPDAHPFHIRLTGDLITGQLLGAQMLGHVAGEVAKRIDSVAMALFHKMNIEALNELDLSYTPPLGSPWDPIQMSAQAWVASL